MAHAASELTLPAPGTYPLGTLYNAHTGKLTRRNLLGVMPEAQDYPNPTIRMVYLDASNVTNDFKSLQLGGEAQLSLLMGVVKAGEASGSYHEKAMSIARRDSCAACFERSSRVKRINIDHWADNMDWNLARRVGATHVLVEATEGCRGIIELRATSAEGEKRKAYNAQAKTTLQQTFKFVNVDASLNVSREKAATNASHDVMFMIDIYGYNGPVNAMTAEGIRDFLAELPNIMREEDAQHPGYRPQLTHTFVPLSTLAGYPVDFPPYIPLDEAQLRKAIDLAAKHHDLLTRVKNIRQSIEGNTNRQAYGKEAERLTRLLQKIELEDNAIAEFKLGQSNKKTLQESLSQWHKKLHDDFYHKTRFLYVASKLQAQPLLLENDILKAANDGKTYVFCLDSTDTTESVMMKVRKFHESVGANRPRVLAVPLDMYAKLPFESRPVFDGNENESHFRLYDPQD